MIWPKMICWEEAAADGNAGGGDAGKDTGKIIIGTKEYKTKDLEAAHTLYEALQDETTGKEIITTLARRAGLLDSEGEVKRKVGETEKQAESRVARALKAKLGKDYEKFADSVGPAFDDIIEELLNERLGQRDAATSKDSWDRSVDTFTDTHVLTSEIEDTMKDLMEDSPPNFGRKNFDAQKYLTRIYKNACEELDVEPEVKSSRKSGLKSKSKGEDMDMDDIQVREAPKHASIDDAVEAAMKGIRFKRRS